MSFTITNAKTLADSWTDEVVSTTDALIWGNEFLQNEINSKAWEESTVPFVATKDIWYNLPIATAATEEDPAIAGFIRTISLTDSNGRSYANYIIRNKKIKFADTDTFTLTYTGYPAKLASITEAVPLQDAFMYPMAKFLLFKQFSQEYDDADMYATAEKYRGEYLIGLKSIYDEIEMDSENESFQIRPSW